MMKLKSMPFLMYWFNDVPNFGDLLGPAILKGIAGIEPQWVRSGAHSKWLTVGSVMECACCGDIVWGSGTKRAVRHNVRGSRIYAVRGPRSHGLLYPSVGDVAYGDPAILMPLVYRKSIEPENLDGRQRIGLVAHYVDKDLLIPPACDRRLEWIEIDVQGAWQSVIDSILRCELVISSSLHGIIIAEAYDIPAVWVQPSQRIIGGLHKFLDYFEGTGRKVNWADWENVKSDPFAFSIPKPELSSQRAALLTSLELAIEETLDSDK